MFSNKESKLQNMSSMGKIKLGRDDNSSINQDAMVKMPGLMRRNTFNNSKKTGGLKQSLDVIMDDMA